MKLKSLLLLFALALSACGSRQASKQNSSDEPRPISFDGALVQRASDQVAHGERLSRVLGCRGCHGKELRGELWDDDPKEYGIMWASNLSRAVPAMSDAQFLALMRTGEHPVREKMWVMPSELFQHLSAPDMTALLAYLRTLKPAGKVSPPPSPGPRALREIASGKVRPASTLVREQRAVASVDLGPQHALGRYMTSLTCAECHGATLDGVKGDTPDLVTAGAYSRAEFETLMTKGIPNGPRKLDLMALVAQGRFSRMTVAERDALYAYLKARAERPQ